MRLRENAGLRAVHVKLSVIEDLLHGRLRSVVPVNVPPDLSVFGSIKAPHRPDSVVFLCQSIEWDRAGDFIGGEHAIFEPQYRISDGA